MSPLNGGKKHRKQLSTQLNDLSQDTQHIFNNSDTGNQLSSQIRDLPVNYRDESILVLLLYGYIADPGRWYGKPFSLYSLLNMGQRRWKAKLGKHGWGVDEYDPGHIRHRYLAISYYNT